MNEFEERDDDLMVKLGAYKTGVSKLYIKTLSEVDLDTLRDLVKRPCTSPVMPIAPLGSCGRAPICAPSAERPQ
jgi:hypothetical protein